MLPAMDFLLSSCLTLAVNLHEAVKTVTENQEECEKMSARVGRFSSLVGKLKGEKVPDAMAPVVQEFHNCVESAIRLVGNYTQEKVKKKGVWKYMKKMAHAERDAAKFRELNERLDRTRSGKPIHYRECCDGEWD